MNENLPQQYKNDIFHKIFNKLRLLFFRKENIVNEKQIEYCDNNNTIDNQNKFVNELKVENNIAVNSVYEKKKFMKDLTDNPELLEKFSIDRLKKILQYYLAENEKKRELLKKINA